jgi:hypothetical protein
MRSAFIGVPQGEQLLSEAAQKLHPLSLQKAILRLQQWHAAQPFPSR